jgi:hypothetical protein
MEEKPQSHLVNTEVHYAGAGYPTVWTAIMLFVVITLVAGTAALVVGLFFPRPYRFFTDGITEVASLYLILRYVQKQHPFPIQRRYPHRRLTYRQMLAVFLISISLPFLVWIIDAAFVAAVPVPEWLNDLMTSAFGMDVAFSSSIGAEIHPQ